MSTVNETGSEWSGYCDPCDPANYWIDDDTGERVNAITGERSEHSCPEEEASISPETRALAEDTFGRIERSNAAQDAFARK